MAKKTLYIFNPEHDLALASGEMNYMPPASARRMASELALLPVWYAERGSAVLASSSYNLDYLKRMQELLDISVYLMTEPELAPNRHWISVLGGGMRLYGNDFQDWEWMNLYFLPCNK